MEKDGQDVERRPGAEWEAGPEGATGEAKFPLKTHFSSLYLLSRMLIADKL